MSNRRSLTALFLPLFVSACSSESGESQTFEEEDPALEEAGADAPAELTLSDLIKKTRLGFREEGGAVSAWHATHLVEVFGARVELTPFFPRVPDESGQTPGTPAIPGAALGLETVAVARGDVDLLDAPGAPELEEDGSVTLPRGPLDEHLANTEVGVEQSWTVHQAPGGEGDLEVRIEVDGTQGYVAQTESGLHFEDPISGLGVSYGVATWIDADGVETTVMPAFEDGQIVIRIPSDVVDASAFPVLLDPVISAENGIDNPVLGGAAGDQIDPSIAVGDNVMMAVWTDYRYGEEPVVMGTRLSMNGSILDPTGIYIGGGEHPDVGWNGNAFVVAGAFRYAVEDVTFRWNSHVWSRWIDSSGAPIPETTTSWVHEDSSVSRVRVATKNTTAFVGFELYSNNIPAGGFASVVRVGKTVLLPSGALATPSEDMAPANIGTAVGAEPSLEMACEPIQGTCLAAFDRFDGGIELYGWLWNAGAAQFSHTRSGESHPQVSTYASGFALYSEAEVVDEDGQSATWGAVRPIDGSGVALPGVVASAALSGATDLSCSSTTCLLIGEQAHLTRPADGSLTALGMQLGGRLGFDGDSFLVVESSAFIDWFNPFAVYPSDVFLARIGATGALGSSRRVSTEVTNSETHPDVACSASKCLAVWQDDRGGANAIRGAFTTKAGAPLAAEAFLVGCDPQTGCRSGTRPSVATDGAQFAAAYECAIEDAESGALHAKACFSSLGLDGTVSFMDAPSWSDGLHRPRVAIGPNGLLFAVTQTGLGFGESDLRGVLVDPNGDTVEVVISAAIDDQVEGAVAFDGSNFVVAWEDWRRGAAFGPDVMAARVSPAGGAVLDPNGIQVSVRSNAEARPSVASHGGGNSLIVWEDNRGGSWDVYGARLTGATVADVNGLSFGTPGTSDQKNPSLAFNGTNYQVVWEDDRAGWSELYGRQATTAGAMSGGAFAVATVPGNAGGVYAPALAGDGAGGALVVYERFVAELDQTRVRAKAITP